MEKERAQDFKHHGRFVAPYHFFVGPVLMVNVIYRLVELKNGISFASIWEVLVAVALLIFSFAARVMALSVQDRVIRLEERVRMERLLPADLQPRIDEFTVEQLIGLRFASDEELPALCRQVLEEKVADRRTIERRVKKWRPDYARA